MNVVTCVRDYKFVVNGVLLKEFKQNHSYIMSEMLMNDIIMNSGNGLFVAIRPLDNSIYKKYNGESLENKTITIWRTGGMGDLCFITPYLKKIKEIYPTSKIVFGCGVQYSDIMSKHPLVDEFHSLPMDVEVLSRTDYHLMFEGIIEHNDNAKNKNAYDLFGDYFCIKLEDHEKIPNLPVEKENLDYFNRIDEQKNEIKDPIRIAIHLKTSSKIRDVPVGLWQRLINDLLHLDPRIRVYLMGSPEDVEIGGKIVFGPIAKGRVVQFYQATRGFRDSVAAISKMDLMIGGDSSGLHIAAAFGIPMVGLFGAFNSDLRLRYYKNAIGIDSILRCGPCFLHGSQPCDYSDIHGEPFCMKVFDINQIMNEIEFLLGITSKIPIQKMSPKSTIMLLKMFKEKGEN